MSMQNPRAVIGDNDAPDYARLETMRLVDEYKGFANTLADLAAEAMTAIPAGVADDPTALRVGGIIKRFRDLSARLENTRVVEVEPNLRRMNAQNAFFNGLMKLIQPDNKIERRTSPGWIDRLQGLIDAYQADKERKERERLAAEAAERKRIADAAAAAAEAARLETERLAREARERQETADRARTEETRAAKQKIADDAAAAALAQAGAARVADAEATATAANATDARIGTLAKSADLVRTRGVTEEGAGVTLTSGKESFAYVTDRVLLVKSAEKLFIYFNDNEVEKAVRAYAKATNYHEPMEGAEIGWKTKGITR